MALPAVVLGASALFALFWQKKNARLAARLDTVIETSERVRKEFRPPPPRVTIDTSFLEQSAARAEAAAQHDAEFATKSDHPIGAQDGVEASQGEQATSLNQEILDERDGHHEVEAPPDDARWSVADAQQALAALREAAAATRTS